MQVAPPDPQAFEQARQRFLDGLAAFQAGRFAEAEQAYVASLALLPGRVSTLINLAAARLRLGRPEQAMEAIDRILVLEPGNAEAWLHRADAFGQLSRHADALASLDRALKLGALPAGPLWLRHGQTLQALGRPHEALASYDRALAADAGIAQAWTNRGSLLREMKRGDEAAAAFRQALALGADAELHRYYLASVTGEEAAPPVAPGHYVETLFDDYANDFDAHLVGLLGYQAHRTLVTHLAALGRGPFRSALDLGCGTGLCAPLLRPMAQMLTGVDLSRQMMDKARALGLYEHLVHADIVHHLQETDERHDLVTAADVFIYVGDLAPVFAALDRVLEPGGIFCFSAETAADESAGFELLASLRYAHSERYLRELAARHGLEVVQLVRAPIREDQRESIAGLFVYLSRP